MLKQLLSSVREYKRSSLLAPLFVSCEVILEVLIPLLIADLIDKGVELGDMNAILRYGLLLMVCAALSLVMGTLSGHHAAIASAGFAKNLRHDMYYKVQDYSFSNIDKFSTASLVTRLTTDVTNLQMAYQMIIRVAVRAPLMMTFALFAAIYIDRRVAVVFLVVIPLLALALGFIITHAHPIFKQMFKIYDRLNSVVQENLRGIRVVKAYVREDYEVERFTGVSGQIYDYSVRAEKLLAWNGPVMQTAIYGCMIFISWFAARFIVDGSMSTGNLMSLMTYIMQILMSLMMVSMILVMITMARASGERIAEVLTEEPDLKSPADAVTHVADGSITFRDVEFRYSAKADTAALKGVDLDIKSGQMVGIIGGTGSSKSTLVQLIPRLYDVTGGAVLVGGRDVREYDLEVLREQVAMVLQKNELFSGTIKENLRWGNKDATDEELVHACRLAQADDFIRQFPDGYDTYIEQGGTNVSGGQKQRLCIARALLKKPKILILDDSTSAVDTHTDAMIRKAFREEIPDTTKLIIAQRISSVEEADMIIVMDNGTINAVGTHSELLASNAIYREVYESQQKGGGDRE